MISRNSGIQGRTRTAEEREPKTEIITSRNQDKERLSSHEDKNKVISGVLRLNIELKIRFRIL